MKTCHGRINKEEEEPNFNKELGKEKIIPEKIQEYILRNDRKNYDKKTLTMLLNFALLVDNRLPEMGLDYILRVLFNSEHYSLVLVKKEEVLGGCCIRPVIKGENKEKNFIELVFVVISGSMQVIGLGSRIMNTLFEYLKAQDINKIIVFSDNGAVGFFRKQGFGKFFCLSQKDWCPYVIKYYGGSFMYLELFKNFNYLEAKENYEKQKLEILLYIYYELDEYETIYPGLKFGPNEQYSVENIPGLTELYGVNYKMELLINFNRTCLFELWLILYACQESSEFRKPVSADITGYYEKILTPMNLSIMRYKLDTCQYHEFSGFENDIKLICSNCNKFNKNDPGFLLRSDLFFKKFLNVLKIWKQNVGKMFYFKY